MGLGMKLSNPHNFSGSRALMVVHLVLVLLIPFLFTQMGGCQGEKETMPLNLGPEIAAEEVDHAIASPLAGTDPTSIRLGEGFVVSETQELGVGAGYAILSDTAQTVVERQEDPSEIFLTVVEHKQKYVNGEVQKTSTEIPYRIEKGSSAQGLTEMSPSSKPAAEVTESARLRPEIEQMMRERSAPAFLSSIRARNVASEAIKAQSGVSASSETKVTYHNLRTSVAQEAPPVLVQQQDACAGTPNCKITVHRISFDMVFWENGKPDRVRWDLAMSPDAPYLAGMMNKCVTGLAHLSGNQGDILVRQCVPVVNFRYGQ